MKLYAYIIFGLWLLTCVNLILLPLAGALKRRLMIRSTVSQAIHTQRFPLVRRQVEEALAL